MSNSAKLDFTNKVKFICDGVRNFLNYIDSNKLVLYLYNPFNWQILGDVLEKIKSTNIECYIDPLEEDNIICNGFSLIHKIKGKYPGDYVSFYEYSKNITT